MKPRILLVDDAEGVREALASMLARRYDVVTACDAAEALALLESGDVAPVVVSDYRMPGENGLELLARVKRAWPHTVGILLSATQDPALAASALAQGDVFRFLAKPVAFDALSQAIESALELHAELAARASALDPASTRRRITCLERVQHLALELVAARGLQELAERAAHTIVELFPRRGVLVQLWEPALQRSIQATGGPEMSDRMWSLVVGEPSLGEIVIDVRPMPGSSIEPEGEEALRSIANLVAAAARATLEREARERAHSALVLELARLMQLPACSGARHLERISAYSRLLAQGLLADGCSGGAIDERWIDDLGDAAALHDIGETGVPDSILLKPGPLDTAEREIMMRHVEIGAAALDVALSRGGALRMLTLAREICAGHHERWDGSGYPRALRGDAIPLAARIVGLVDVYDALTSPRPYRAAWTHGAALDWIRARATAQFDPQLVATFVAREAQVDALRARMQDEQPERGAGMDALERVA